MEGAEEMGTDVADPGAGGVRCAETRNIFYSGLTSHSPFGIRNVGGAPPRIVHTQGGFHSRLVRWLTGKQPRRRPNGRWEYPPPSPWGGSGYGGLVSGVRVHHSESEYGHIVCFNTTDSGDLHGYAEEGRVAASERAVGTGGG